MIKYLFLVITLTPYIALASALDKTQDTANPLDLLSQSSVPKNCNDMSDTEPDDDDEIIDFTVNASQDVQNEHLGVVLSQKRPLEKTQEDNNPKKKIKYADKEKHKCTFSNCIYITTSADKLKLHICKHTGEKPYKCVYEGCNYSAKRREHYNVHLRRHTGEKPFKCNWAGCNHATAHEGDLKVHKRVHTGEKPYKCDYAGCNYASSQNINLLRHKRTHTGEKSFKCTTEGCSYATADQSALLKHKKKKHIVQANNNSAVIKLLINAGKNKTKGNQ